MKVILKVIFTDIVASQRNLLKENEKFLFGEDILNDKVLMAEIEAFEKKEIDSRIQEANKAKLQQLCIFEKSHVINYDDFQRVLNND
jgi:hypothetical protein